MGAEAGSAPGGPGVSPAAPGGPGVSPAAPGGPGVSPAAPEAPGVSPAVPGETASEDQGLALSSLLARGGIRSVYQPLVELEHGSVIGYDALARGPAGSTLESPDQLFAAARSSGRLSELDLRCRAVALQGALDADLGSWLTLFMTVEPEALGAPLPEELERVLRSAEQRLRVVLEIGESALGREPAELRRAVAWAHERYWGIALDDVGRNRLSLALLPILDPDVIKLDLRLLATLPPREAAIVVRAVLAHQERRGATILAEGIETERQLELALTLGATLGQGWLFGRPGPLPRDLRPSSKSTVRLRTVAADPDLSTPFAVVSAARPARHARASLLSALVRQLEDEALAAAEDLVVLATVPSAERFPAEVAARYASLATRAPLVAAFGRDLPAMPAPGVRGGSVADDDPLGDEWSLLILGPFTASAIVASDLGDLGPLDQRRFRFCVTTDRDLVVTAAGMLLDRIVSI